MSEERKTPKRRFKEFQNAGAWEKHKLLDIVDLYNGLTYSPNDIVSDGGTLVLRSSNVKNDEVVDADNVYVNSKIINCENVKEGDIIVVVRNGSRALIGKHAQIKQPMPFTVIGAFMAGIRSKHPEFINALLSTAKFNSEVEKSMGATINQITNGMFAEMQFMTPSEDEQNKVGLYFKKFDNLITLNQRKLEKLKALKKAYLSQMFPSDGESKPKLRFAGFNDEWEKIKLGDIGSTYTGLSGKSKEDFGHGKGKYVTYMNVFSNSVADISLTDAIEIDKKQNEVKKGDVFFTTSSETPNEVGMSSVWIGDNSNIYLNSFCFGYRPNVKLDNYYVAYIMRSDLIRKQMVLLAQGISRYNISKNKVMETEAYFPIMKEQQKIGKYFNKINNLITLHQRKLEKLQNLKKAYLNEMFV